MIEKLLSLKQQPTSKLVQFNNRLKFSNYIVRVYASRDKTTAPSFQMLIDSKAKTVDVLSRARDEFSLTDMHKYSLFEVGDNEVLLERVLSANSVLINTLVNWRAFILIVKQNYLGEWNKRDDEGLAFFDSCHSLGICQRCLRYYSNI